MGVPPGDGRSPAPIDRPLLEFLQSRLHTTEQVTRAAITDESGHLELRVEFAQRYYPESVTEAILAVRWYTNDDFTVHYREAHVESDWKCRWDRHPNPHNTRDHFHPPPTASTSGENASWPTDHRELLSLVLDDVERRITDLWDESSAEL